MNNAQVALLAAAIEASGRQHRLTTQEIQESADDYLVWLDEATN